MKKLYRKKETRKIAGVCAGLGEYFDIDAVFVRIIFIVAIFISGIGLLAYLVAWIVMPEQSTEQSFKNEELKGEKEMIVKEVSIKSRLGALLFCFFLGWLGVHRFYVGKAGTGFLMIITLGGLGIWWAIDFIMILIGSFTDKGGKFVYDWMPGPVHSN
jgi:phage shock protein PspC (stress-responsive transcriptional regulator)/TM2 domain-containing membrane protein YozV